jgi:acyl carrier protein
MTIEEKIALLAEILGLEPSVISPDRELSTFDEWDSIGRLFVISMFKDTFDKDLEADRLRGFKIVSDILDEMSK